MCGPMALWASGIGGPSTSRREAMIRLCGYHLGRLITFVSAGAVAGMIGGMVTAGGDWLGWQQTAARIGGSAMVGLGVWKLLHWIRPIDTAQSVVVSDLLAARKSRPGERFSLWMAGKISKLRPMIAGLPTNLRAVAIGVVTTWLPCGWLYLFLLVAAATASLGAALVVMIAFWIGTLPALSALVAGAVGVSPRVRPAMPLLVASVLILTGLYTASGRAATDLMPLGQAARRIALDAGPNEISAGVDVAQSVQPQRGWIRLLTGLSGEALPCCDPAAGPVESVGNR
jgi:sulfite exporter TauE/SafE